MIVSYLGLLAWGILGICVGFDCERKKIEADVSIQSENDERRDESPNGIPHKEKNTGNPHGFSTTIIRRSQILFGLFVAICSLGGEALVHEHPPTGYLLFFSAVLFASLLAAFEWCVDINPDIWRKLIAGTKAVVPVAFISMVAATVLLAWPLFERRSPFRVVDSMPLWARNFDGRRFGQQNVLIIAISHGLLRAANTGDNGISVDFFIHLAITNISDQPRRIAEYQIETAESNAGPWTRLCNIGFGLRTLFFVFEPDPSYEFPSDEMMDRHLSGHVLSPGDTVSGWVGAACPASVVNECFPAFVKYILYDSRGEKSEYIEDHTQPGLKTRSDPHDFLAEAGLTPKKASRSFTGMPSLRPCVVE